MAEFPTYEEMAKEVAEKALDEFTYKDKTLREWIEIIVAQDLLAIAELEKIKEEIKEYGSIWVQYSIKGHTDKDIDDIVDDVLKQAKQSFIRRLDKHITELKGE